MLSILTATLLIIPQGDAATVIRGDVCTLSMTKTSPRETHLEIKSNTTEDAVSYDIPTSLLQTAFNHRAAKGRQLRQHAPKQASTVTLSFGILPYAHPTAEKRAGLSVFVESSKTPENGTALQIRVDARNDLHLVSISSETYGACLFE